MSTLVLYFFNRYIDEEETALLYLMHEVMEMQKKYFFFDIDGTLTDRKTNKIVPSAQLALQKLQEEGHFVAIATGRAHYKAIHFMEEVGLHHMVCCGGGALVVNDTLVHNIPLDLEKAKHLVKEAEAHGFGCLLMLDDSIDVYSRNNRFVEQCGERQEPTRYFIDETLDYDALEQIYKVYISIPKDREHELPSIDTIGHLRFVPEYLIFQYDEKHQGILDMMEEIQGNISDVVVFGDDTNDLVMFDPRWTSIAMGNACEELKAKADYVTKANVDDGIYHACKKFGWIKE